MTTPRESEVTRAIIRFRTQLLSADAAAADALIQAYGPAGARLLNQVGALLSQLEGQMTFNQVKRLERYQALLRQIQREVSIFTPIAEGIITDVQRDAVAISLQGTRTTVQAALPPALNLQLLGQAGIEWNALPVEAFESFIGVTGNAAGEVGPLRTLLEPLGAETVAGVESTIGEGILRGQGPRDVARRITNQVGMPLTRSLRISRTEMTRAFRESNRLQFAANEAIVKGYRRHAKKDSETCFACIAKDGQRYELSQPLDEHPSGRCSLEPITVSYRDLGLDVDEPDFSRELAPDWFRGQSDVQQLSMMGPGKFKAWKGGQFAIEDMAKVTQNDIWGPSAVEKSLKELVR